MEKIDIQGVPETMLQTLYARAAYSQKNGSIFYDEKSVEAVKALDYDFSSAQKDMLMRKGVMARTLLLDQMVKAYIEKYPGITVVNIACGMDTRVYRLDNGKLRWYNLDLPETIEVRRRFFEETGRISTIAKSAMDESWAREVEPTEEKVLVIIEGLTMVSVRSRRAEDSCHYRKSLCKCRCDYGDHVAVRGQTRQGKIHFGL